MKHLTLLLALILGSAAVRADEIRIYGGRLKRDYRTGNHQETATLGLYIVIDYTTAQFATITYDLTKRTKASDTTIVSFHSTVAPSPVPKSPLSSKAREIFVADATDGVGAAFCWMKSTAAPALLTTSSMTTTLVSRALSYHFVTLRYAVDSWEETGAATYQKALTILSNDAFGNLAGGTAVVMEDLKKRGFIN